MTQNWQIDGPKVIDVGTEQEVVRALKIALVAGRVDIVTHDDSPTARLEVHEVVGRPLEVRWDGSTLRVSHVKDKDGKLWESLKRFNLNLDKLSARISISVPAAVTVSASTVSAEALVNGVRGDVKGNTVSGSVTLDDIVGNVKANTVSGEVECHALTGDLNANTVSGAITVQASTLRGIKLNTVSGDITLDLLDGQATIGSNSVSGDVTVRIPAGRGYDVTARTGSGHVVIDGTSMTGKQGQHGGQLTDGDKALAVKANSVSGDVVVLRAASGVQDRPGGVHDRPGGVQDRPGGVQDRPGGHDGPTGIQGVS